MADPTRTVTNHTTEPTLGALVHDVTQQIPQLVRSEIRLAQAEVTQKGKEAGVGIGMFSAAGLLAFYGLAVLIAAGVIGLANAVPAWLSAVVVGAVLLAGAALAALLGKKHVTEATPAKPERALEGIKEDIATVKGERS